MSGHPAPDHCIRAARQGCGCKRCVAWRRALADLHTDTPTLFEQR